MKNVLTAITLFSLTACPHSTQNSGGPISPSSASMLTPGPSPVVPAGTVVPGTTTPAPAPLRIFMGNTESFDEKLRLVDIAQQRIDAAFFIVKPDPSTAVFFDKILAKAQSGVKVRLLFDAFNALSAQKLFQPLMALGRGNLSIAYFRPPPNNLLNATKYFSFSTPQALAAGLSLQSTVSQQIMDASRRLHHKLIVTDGRYVLGGGRNLSDAYHLETNQPLALSRQTADKLFVDTDFSIDSPAIATQATETFDKYWTCGSQSSCNAGTPVSLETMATSLNESTFLDQMRAQEKVYFDSRTAAAPSTTTHQGVFTASTADIKYIENQQQGLLSILLNREDPLTREWLDAIRNVPSGEDLIFHNAYIFMSPQMLLATRDAIARGVNVTLVTNSKETSDSQIVQIAAKPQLRALSEFAQSTNKGTFKVYEYITPEILHTKVTLAGKTILVGSTNADMRSEYLDTQNNIVVKNAKDAQTGEDLALTYKKWLQQNILSNKQRTRAMNVNDFLGVDLSMINSFMGNQNVLQNYLDQAQFYDLHKKSLLDGKDGDDARQKLLTYFIQL